MIAHREGLFYPSVMGEILILELTSSWGCFIRIGHGKHLPGGTAKQSRLAQVCAASTAWELPRRETGTGKLLGEDSLQNWWRDLEDPACLAKIPLGRGWSDTQAHLQQYTPCQSIHLFQIHVFLKD